MDLMKSLVRLVDALGGDTAFQAAKRPHYLEG